MTRPHNDPAARKYRDYSVEQPTHPLAPRRDVAVRTHSPYVTPPWLGHGFAPREPDIIACAYVCESWFAWAAGARDSFPGHPRESTIVAACEDGRLDPHVLRDLFDALGGVAVQRAILDSGVLK